jgi:hypothetical protein
MLWKPVQGRSIDNVRRRIDDVAMMAAGGVGWTKYRYNAAPGVHLHQIRIIWMIVRMNDDRDGIASLIMVAEQSPEIHIHDLIHKEQKKTLRKFLAGIEHRAACASWFRLYQPLNRDPVASPVRCPSHHFLGTMSQQ